MCVSLGFSVLVKRIFYNFSLLYLNLKTIFFFNPIKLIMHVL